MNEFYLEIRKGNVPGHSWIEKYGGNEDVDAAEDIWREGGNWVPPTVAQLMTVVSNNAADTSAGTGARTIRIEGLDSNWDFQTEDVTLNGTTAVDTTNTWHRVFRAYVLTAGSGEVNAGYISVEAKTDVTTQAGIDSGRGQTEQAIYTIPAGKTGYLVRYYSSIRRNSPSGAQIDLDVKMRVDASQADAPVLVKHSNGVAIDGQNPYNHKFEGGIVCPEKSDVWLRIAGVSDVNTAVDGGFDIILVDN